MSGRSLVLGFAKPKQTKNHGDGDGGKVLEISVATDPAAPRGEIWAKEQFAWRLD